MKELIACLSSGKGTLGHVSRVISEHDWSKIILVTDELSKEKFTAEKPVEFVIIDSKLPVNNLIQQLTKEFKEKITDTEVAVNLASDSGKEHMAILSAIMKSGVGFRLVALTKDGVKEI